jgi:type II secretory pathway component GspD/PulD (secretin)
MRQPSTNQAARLTLGVDTRTNRLIVSSNQAVYNQIEELVAALDKAAYDANRTVQVITLDHANAGAMQWALGSLMPKVKISTTGKPKSLAGTTGSKTSPQPQGRQQRANESNRDATRQFFEQRMRERSQRRNNDLRSGQESGDRSRGRENRRSRRGRNR